jgi:hypothetical protein
VRRLVVPLLAMLLAAVAVGPPVAAAPSDTGQQQRAFVYRLTMAGYVAIGSWTTCTAPEPGDVCTDTVVYAFRTVTREGKWRDRAPVLKVEQYVYEVLAEEPGFRPLLEQFGRTESAAIGTQPRLDWLTASGTVPLSICTDFDETTPPACSGDVAVSVRWTGTAPATRLHDSWVSTDRTMLMREWGRGWERAAGAVATVDGVPLGASSDAVLLRLWQGEVRVYHQPGPPVR